MANVLKVNEDSNHNKMNDNHVNTSIDEDDIGEAIIGKLRSKAFSFDAETDSLIPPPSDGDGLNLRFVFRLTGFGTDSSNVTRFIIQICCETLGGRTWLVGKRYSQFLNLWNELRAINENPPSLPGKHVIKKVLGFQNQEFLRERARGLSTFLWKLAADPVLCNSKPVRIFLWSNTIKDVPRNMLPTTPLMTSQLVNRNNQQSDSFSVLRASSGQPNNNNGHKRTTMQDLEEPVIDDGRWFLSTNSALDLQRGFASEGLLFSEADLIPSSHDSESTDDDSLQQQNRLYSTQSEPMCSFLNFGRTSKPKPTSSRSDTALLDSLPRQQSTPSSSSFDSLEDEAPHVPPDRFPKLRIVILLVGSRGDVQPYVALAKALRGKGHTVRVAAHECFREWIVQKHNVPFAPIAGDPKELLRMVVENNMFSYEFVKNGMTNHRSWASQVLIDCWNACTQENPDAPREPRKPNHLIGPGHAFAALESKFRADLVIANPPSFAGWHCAEALGVPLLMTFPMPWTRTKEFPSPFTSLSALTSPESLNWMSYGAVDRLIWLGLGDLINRFRVETLFLPPIWTLSAKGHRYIHDYRVPWLYCWSPSVLSKPKDWGAHVLVSGYLFLDDSDGSDWKPSDNLLKCFNSNRKVVFIGFGSIVVKNPDDLSQLILQAAKVLIEKGYNVLVQKGWAGMDFPVDECGDGLFLVGPAPHSWIFPRCAVVVHHGGSGTTAEGLKVGIPTVIVPFFGDQFFWGETVKRRGLGDTEPYLTLSPLRLVECILNAAHPSIKERCVKVSQGIKEEDGLETSIAFIENIVFGFDGFSVDLIQDEEWRKWPYYDLKKRVKTERYQNIKGFRKVKSRFKSLLHVPGSSIIVGGKKTFEFANGVELKKVTPIRHVSSNNDVAQTNHHHHHHLIPPSATANQTAFGREFPYLPEMHTGRVPDGHTAYSWFGKLSKEDSTCPMGHTNYSWNAASW